MAAKSPDDTYLSLLFFFNLFIIIIFYLVYTVLRSSTERVCSFFKAFFDNLHKHFYLYPPDFSEINKKNSDDPSERII